MAYPESVNRLMEKLKALPGVGDRTAERLALFIARHRTDLGVELAAAIREVVEKVRCCSVCFNTSETDPCPVCASVERDRTRILVVERPGDLNAFEEAGWNGLYHVLQGALDPVEGVLPEDLTLEPLLARLEEGEIREVIIATNPDYEGDGTALLLGRRLEGRGVKVTRIARGIPTGGKIEYASRAMLSDALQGRMPIKG